MFLGYVSNRAAAVNPVGGPCRRRGAELGPRPSSALPPRSDRRKRYGRLPPHHRHHHGRPRRHRAGGDRQGAGRPGPAPPGPLHHLRDERAAALRGGRGGVRRLLVARPVQRPAPRLPARRGGRRLRPVHHARLRHPLPQQDGRRGVDALLPGRHRRGQPQDRRRRRHRPDRQGELEAGGVQLAGPHRTVRPPHRRPPATR